ncbi:MFS transporter [Effusibacillus dendaii]|uniref:MFS transporter n=1 Tax=Effusibacillus dendaii TaxID=2743772 RepID=A0A7I8DJD0_9BACL|nr:MFS transporter [Effusibacillus dendaii]BCJ87951.1 MFS transporter [Effusibacillus dendaii]
MQAESVSSRMDRLPISPVHRKAMFLIGIGMFFDLYDIFLSGTLGSVLTKQFHVSSAQLPLLLGSSFLGMFIGSIVLNNLADRVGRKKAFMINLGIYSIFTFLGAFSPNATLLILFRFLAGLGLGAELPLSDTYLSELLPAKNRGRYIAWAYTFGFLGVPCIGFLARGLVPMQPMGFDGWRWLFVIGAIGAVIIWLLRGSLPESPRWLESVGRVQEAHQLVDQFEKNNRLTSSGASRASAVSETHRATSVPTRLLFSPTYRKRTVMLWIFQILQTIGYYGFGSLVPIVLGQKGYTIVSSLEFTALTFIGYPIGSFLSLFVIERIDRKWLIVFSALGMAVFGLLFGYSTSENSIVLFGFLYTLISNVFSNGLHTYQAEIFPTSIRATAAGTAYSLSRLTSGLMPLVMLPVLKNYGATSMFGVVAAAMVLIMLDIGILGPRTTGRSLEAVNQPGEADSAASGTSRSL